MRLTVKRLPLFGETRDLKEYKKHPDKLKKATLAQRFDEIFTQKTSYETLNQALARIHKNKAELLRVLEHPDIPLHTNGSETDIRDYVKKKKVSGGTRSAEGRRCRDTFASLKKTCRKLDISFWHYLTARLGRQVPIDELCFLGYQFKGRFLILSPKSLQNFKHRIRELTNRTWGVSWQYRYLKLKQYIVGWMNYFALVTFDPIERLDHWIRRRIRMCYLHRYLLLQYLYFHPPWRSSNGGNREPVYGT